MGIARSASGDIAGPWRQDAEPLWAADGGHGMIFRSFEGQLMLTLHTPNESPKEHALFVPIVEEDGQIRLLT